MKKLIFCLSFILILIFSFVGCNSKTNEKEVIKEEVIINLPKDNTVNGYKTESNASSKLPDTVNGDNIKVISPNESKNQSTQSQTQYCANINTKIFHKISCNSVGTMKAENKYITTNRNSLVSDGFSPCGKCKP